MTLAEGTADPELEADLAVEAGSPPRWGRWIRLTRLA